VIEPLYLEAAAEDDVSALTALERESFTHPWSARNFRESIVEPDRGRVVVVRSAQTPPDGFRGIRAYCIFQTVLDELHVHNLAVNTAMRGQGLGRWLLRTVLGIGARRGAITALLEVRRSNWAALRLYHSLGFETISVRRDYYASPREDALVLRKQGLG
jgi:ribosomal-protein-alanine N-acetyltransferase